MGISFHRRPQSRQAVKLRELGFTHDGLNVRVKVLKSVGRKPQEKRQGKTGSRRPLSSTVPVRRRAPLQRRQAEVPMVG